jgi:hypothetical protein
VEHTGYSIPLGKGRSRSVLIRPTDRDVVQVAILSVYGNVLEAVDLDAEVHGAVVSALWLAREDADRARLDGLRAAHADALERRARAYAGNRYLPEHRPGRVFA